MFLFFICRLLVFGKIASISNFVLIVQVADNIFKYVLFFKVTMFMQKEKKSVSVYVFCYSQGLKLTPWSPQTAGGFKETGFTASAWYISSMLVWGAQTISHMVDCKWSYRGCLVCFRGGGRRSSLSLQEKRQGDVLWPKDHEKGQCPLKHPTHCRLSIDIQHTLQRVMSVPGGPLLLHHGFIL